MQWGILITANHIEMVLVNLGDEIIKKDRIRLKFTAELFYCTEVAQKVKNFLEGEISEGHATWDWSGDSRNY